MINLLYGIAVVALLWWLSRVFARANPTALAKALKTVGGVASLGAAAILLLRGRFDVAFLLFGVGAWLLGWRGFALPGFGQRTTKTPGSVSRVRSAMVEMELDHDSGAMEGTVLAGAFTGRRLGELDEKALNALYGECAQVDPDGRRLLEAYFDRRFPGWRVHAECDPDAGTAGQAKTGAMTEEEAYQILGLQPGAGPDEIRRAHRTLMKKLHPDQGGTTYLAARVNQAKDILLSRHR